MSASSPIRFETLAPDLISQSTLHLNLGQEVMVTTEDKIRLCMSEHAMRLGAQQGWVAPVSMLITVVVVLLTSDFHDALLDKAVWKALFVLVAIGCGLWSFRAVRTAMGVATSVDRIVDELKRSSPNRTAVSVPLTTGLTRTGSIEPREPRSTSWTSGIVLRVSSDRPRGLSDYVGTWRMTAVPTSPAFFLVLDGSFNATRENGTAGTWRLVGNEAHIEWRDGWFDVLRPTGDGATEKCAWKAGANRSGPPTNTQPAMKAS
jgi:hypothetical protein